MSYDVLDFYLEQSPDYKGRTLSDIITMSDYQLEIVHDYIQVLFPIPEPSKFNEYAPILTDEEAALIRESIIARRSFINVVNKMCEFYGKYNHWCMPMNHNLLRITRIIRCVSLILGFEAAEKVFNKFISLCAMNDFIIDQETLNYWTLAKSGIALHITHEVGNGTQDFSSR